MGSDDPDRAHCKSLARLSWRKVHFRKPLRGSCGWVWFFIEVLAGSLLVRCVFLVGSVCVFRWFLFDPRLH